MACQSVWFSLEGKCSFLFRHLPQRSSLSLFLSFTLTHCLMHCFALLFSHQSSGLCSDKTSTIKVNHRCLWNVIREQESGGENERGSMFPRRAQNLNCVLWEMCDGEAVHDAVSPLLRWETWLFPFFRSSGEALIENGRIKRHRYSCSWLLSAHLHVVTQFLYFFLMMGKVNFEATYTNHLG